MELTPLLVLAAYFAFANNTEDPNTQIYLNSSSTLKDVAATLLGGGVTRAQAKIHDAVQSVLDEFFAFYCQMPPWFHSQPFLNTFESLLKHAGSIIPYLTKAATVGTRKYVRKINRHAGGGSGRQARAGTSKQAARH